MQRIYEADRGHTYEADNQARMYINSRSDFSERQPQKPIPFWTGIRLR